MCRILSIPKEPIPIPIVSQHIYPFNTLTHREQEIALVIVTGGFSRKMMAEFFNITEKTIDMHMTSVYKKCFVTMSVDPLWELTVKLLKWGILTLEDLKIPNQTGK